MKETVPLSHRKDLMSALNPAGRNYVTLGDLEEQATHPIVRQSLHNVRDRLYNSMSEVDRRKLALVIEVYSTELIHERRHEKIKS